MSLFRFNAVVLAASLSGTLWAATPIYVSPSGLDTNDGTTEAAPVLTLVKAYELVDSGGKIIVDDGSYTDSLVLTKPVSLEGANAGISPVTGTRGDESIIMSDGPMITIDAGAEGSTIDGFKFTGAGNDSAAGIISGNANDVVVKCNIIDGNSGHGIAVATCSGWTIDSNLISNVTGSSRSGMYMRVFQNSTVKNNKIENTVYAGMICDSFQDVTVENNIINNTPQPGIQVANSAGPVTVSGNTITQANTNHAADKAAIALYPNALMVNVTNNILTDNDGAVSVRAQAGSVSANVHVNFNNILNNTAPAIRNRAQDGGTLDAANNWWGSATGPAAADLAETNVIFSPWLSGPASVGQWKKY